MRFVTHGMRRLRHCGIGIALLFIGCGSAQTSGTLSVGVTDAATDQYQAVYVTIKSVQVHASGAAEESWSTVLSPATTVNLLDLANGVRTELGAAAVDAGTYTQMRLILGDTPASGTNIQSKAHPFANYVIDTSGTVQELKVPSGMQTGVKIVTNFTISANQTTELLLDFDAAKSVVIAGSSAKYLLQPTIKIMNTAEYSIISGKVTDNANGAALGGAMVSAQTYTAAATDRKDVVVIQTATVSDGSGNYKLFLAPGTYHVVAVKNGYAVGAAAVTTSAGATSTKDFALVTTTTGTIAGSVAVSGGDGETYATISVRQETTIDGSLVTIEVIAVNVADGGSYSVTVPTGTYTVVSSSTGKTTTETTAVAVGANATTTVNVGL